MKRIIERRQMEMSALRKLCIKNDWCTCCTNEQYDDLLNMTKVDNLTTEKLGLIAAAIQLVSDEDTQDREITSIMYDLAEICYTVFEEVDV